MRINLATILTIIILVLHLYVGYYESLDSVKTSTMEPEVVLNGGDSSEEDTNIFFEPEWVYAQLLVIMILLFLIVLIIIRYREKLI